MPFAAPLVGAAGALIALRPPSSRGLLRTVFAAVKDDFTAQSLIDLLNPKLKKVFTSHPEIVKQFLSEMDRQLDTVKTDKEAFGKLREEMEADIKELNEEVTKDPSMLEAIEKNLGDAVAGLATAGNAVAQASMPLPLLALSAAGPPTGSCRSGAAGVGHQRRSAPAAAAGASKAARREALASFF
eukprot:TRINITY_DN14686_c0_g1_i1.p1 TRINITY_DN14686_c0_g1~~TRINITY_DN14686_c0_g1_i1.p1  ORF type:complete len:217 (-),score=49.63 TRINITY_DN14686_c0_g1_i1:67-621(-)